MKLRLAQFSYATLIVTGLLVVAAGCGALPNIYVEQQSQELAADVQLDDKIDILFVVDNSISMNPFQKKLADAFDKFITEFSSKNLDFHVGIISTETMGSRDYWVSGGSDLVTIYSNDGKSNDKKNNDSPWTRHANSGPGTLLVYGENNPDLKAAIQNGSDSREHFLSRALSHSDLISKFNQGAIVGDTSYTAEAGMLSTLAALDPDRLLEWWPKWMNQNLDKADVDNITSYNDTLLKNGENIKKWNAGFLRPDSRLVIILLSNEDESLPIFSRNNNYDRQSPYLRNISSKVVTSYEEQVIKQLKTLMKDRTDRLHIAAVIEPDPNADKNGGQSITVDGKTIQIVGNRYGRVYADVAKAFKGDIIDINQPDQFAEKLSKFGKRVVNHITQWTLPQLVQADSVAVCVDETDNNIDDCFQRRHPESKDPAQINVMKGRMLKNTEYEIVPNPADASRPLLRVIGSGITQIPGAKYRIMYTPKAPTSAN